MRFWCPRARIMMFLQADAYADWIFFIVSNHVQLFYRKSSQHRTPRAPKSCSERSKIGNKNNRILEPEKVTKMSSKWLPFGDLGPTMDGSGALWGAQAGPMCDFYKNRLHFHRFQHIFHDFRNDIHTVMASIYISFHIEFQEFQDVSGA